jgi:hypothetical protein
VHKEHFNSRVGHAIVFVFQVNIKILTNGTKRKLMAATFIIFRVIVNKVCVQRDKCIFF